MSTLVTDASNPLQAIDVVHVPFDLLPEPVSVADGGGGVPSTVTECGTVLCKPPASVTVSVTV